MKKSQICPKCQGTRILDITEVAAPIEQSGSRVDHVAQVLVSGFSPIWRLARVAIPARQRHFWQEGWAVAGPVEAFVCRACGYTEFYTRGAESIPVDGKRIRELGVRSEEPYR